MEFKGTKGEWKVEKRLKSLNPFITNGEVKIADLTSPQAITRVEVYNNAQLIATAPELLEALVLMDKTWSGRKQTKKESIAIQKAKKAINKALNNGI